MSIPKHFMEADGDLFDTRQGLHSAPIRHNYAKFDRKLTGGSIALRAAIRNPYVHGGYELIFFTKDGGCLCHKCAKDNYSLIADSRKRNINDGWNVNAVDCAANYDSLIVCDNCSKTIVEDWQENEEEL